MCRADQYTADHPLVLRFAAGASRASCSSTFQLAIVELPCSIHSTTPSTSLPGCLRPKRSGGLSLAGWRCSQEAPMGSSAARRRSLARARQAQSVDPAPQLYYRHGGFSSSTDSSEKCSTESQCEAPRCAAPSPTLLSLAALSRHHAVHDRSARHAAARVGLTAAPTASPSLLPPPPLTG